MKVMVLAGGRDQLCLIAEIRKTYGKNTYIILIDYLIDPIAKQFADKHLQISTLDQEKVLEAANIENIDAIFTSSTDQALTTMAYVAERMNLKTYLSYEQAKVVTNKKNMKLKMFEKKIPTSQFFLITNKVQMKDMNLKLPSVVKPVDCNSSKGVFKIEDMEQFGVAYDIAEAMSRSGKVIVEEFVEGEEFSIDAFVTDGKAEIVLVSQTIKSNRSKNIFTIIQSYYSREREEKIVPTIKPIVQSICEKFAIKQGPLIVQAIVDGNKVQVIEFSARIGGGTKVEFIENITGVNLVKSLIQVTDSGRCLIEKTKNKEFALIQYLYAYPGVYSCIENIDKLKSEGIIKDYYLYKPLGHVVKRAQTSSDRICSFYIEAGSLQVLKDKKNRAIKQIRIINNLGEDIMIHEFGEEGEFIG